MSSDTTEAPRANRNGSPCPPWCTSDHDKLLVADPQVYLNVHHSRNMGGEDWTAPGVRAVQDGYLACEPSKLLVSFSSGSACLQVPAENAGDLADVLEALEDLVRYEASRLREYAAQVRAAAAVVLEAQR